MRHLEVHNVPHQHAKREDFQTNDFTKYMEDLTNIKFTFEAAARDDR